MQFDLAILFRTIYNNNYSHTQEYVNQSISIYKFQQLSAINFFQPDKPQYYYSYCKMKIVS